MLTKHDLYPGLKFKYLNNIEKTIVSICKSRDVYSVDISYKYTVDNKIKYDSVLIDKEDLNEILID